MNTLPLPIKNWQKMRLGESESLNCGNYTLRLLSQPFQWFAHLFASTGLDRKDYKRNLKNYAKTGLRASFELQEGLVTAFNYANWIFQFGGPARVAIMLSLTLVSLLLQFIYTAVGYATNPVFNRMHWLMRAGAVLTGIILKAGLLTHLFADIIYGPQEDETVTIKTWQYPFFFGGMFLLFSFLWLISTIDSKPVSLPFSINDYKEKRKRSARQSFGKLRSGKYR